MSFIKVFLACVLCLVFSTSFSGVIVLSGDTNLINPIAGTNGAPVDPANTTFFYNLLGGGARVAVLANEVIGTNNVGTGNAIQSYYESLSGTSVSRITSSVNTFDLADFDLFVVLSPIDQRLNREGKANVANFLNEGGTLYIAGDIYGSNPFIDKANDQVNRMLQTLRSTMYIYEFGVPLGGGFTPTSGIADSVYTQGISQMTYGLGSEVKGGTSIVYAEATPLVAFQEVAAIPEPASLVMLLSGLMGLGLLRLRTPA